MRQYNAHTTDFRYTTLPIGKGQIRLLQLIRSPKEDSIRCSLSVVETSQSYRALSYVWGTDDPSYTIEVNGSAFKIRRNLFEFLSHAKILWPDMTIWIDAVCIDQANDEERSQQVRAMPSIYSSAHTVITWLGCANSNVTKLFHFLNDGDDQGSSTQWKPLRAYPEYIPIARLRDTTWTPSTESEKIATMMLKDHFSQFCALEYWSRLWIVPEALLASQSILMHANQTLPLAVLQEFVHFAYDDFGMDRGNNKTIHEIFGNEKTFHWVCVTKYDRNGEAGVHMLNSLPHLLNRYGRLQCTDVRDRVFALLAISMSHDSLKAHINYKTPADELFATLLSDKGYNTMYDKFELALGLFECLELQPRSKPAEGMLIKELVSRINLELSCERHYCTSQAYLARHLRRHLACRLSCGSPSLQGHAASKVLVYKEGPTSHRHFVVQQVGQGDKYVLLGSCSTSTKLSRGADASSTYLPLNPPWAVTGRGYTRINSLSCNECSRMDMMKFSLRPPSYAALLNFVEVQSKLGRGY